MKRKDNRLTLKEALSAFIRDRGMEEKLLGVEIETHFTEMMGPPIMKYVKNLNVSDKILFVKMDSPALKSELQYGKSKIIKHINEMLGTAYLTDVKFI